MSEEPPVLAPEHDLVASVPVDSKMKDHPEALPEVQAVNVDGYYGQEVERLELPSLRAEPSAEVYFITDTGNQYAIINSNASKHDQPDHWLLLDRNRTLSERQEKGTVHATPLPEVALGESSINVGKWFSYYLGNTKGAVETITVVDRTKKQEDDGEIEDLPSSHAYTNFWDGIRDDIKATPERDTTKDSLTRDDEKIVDTLLYSTQGLYATLVGMEPSSKNIHWSPEAQREAETGMRELFETAIAPIKIGEPGVTAARRAIVNLGYNPDPKFRATADNLKAQRKGLWYQNWNPGNYEGKLKHVEGDFKQTGDFLHFGINTSEPDELSSPVRVYVSPKPWAVGKVAAELIRKSREQGYEPYGKAWDESSVSGRLNNRRDRILIVPRTENQLRIVMDGLRDIQATKPELFEPETVLLAEKSDMHGIGLAEEPRQDGGPKKSFNGSREVLIESAWRETLTDLVGKETDYEGQSTQLDRLRAAVQSGKKSMKEIVASFRVHAKKQSLEHGISPDNIARNLQ